MGNALQIFFSTSNETRLLLLLGFTLTAAAGMILYSGINLLRHHMGTARRAQLLPRWNRFSTGTTAALAESVSYE